MFKNVKKISIGIVSSLMPFPVFAGLNGDQIETALNNFLDLITGPIGTTLCTLAIVGVGYAWLKRGMMEKEIALTTILGIGIIYSASWLASQFGA